MCFFSAAFPTERHPRLDEGLPGDLDVSGEHDGEAGGVGAGHRVLVDCDQVHGVARRAALLEGRVPVLVVEGGSRGARVVTANAQMLEGRNFSKTFIAFYLSNRYYISLFMSTLCNTSSRVLYSHMQRTLS